MTDINSSSTAENYSWDLNPNNYSWDFGRDGNNPLPGPTNPSGSMLPTEQYSGDLNNITTPSADGSNLNDITTPSADGSNLNDITTPSADGSNLNDITTPAPERPFPGPQTEGTPVTPQGWFLTPAGNQVGLGDRPYGVTQSHDGNTILVSNNGQSTQSLQVVDRTTGAVVQTISYNSPEALYIGVVFSPDDK